MRTTPETLWLRALDVPRRAVVGLLRAYKHWISPLIPPACRYQPTCSEYAREAVERHGTVRGLWLGLKRLLRCQPLGGWGVDPVPVPRKAARRKETMANCQPPAGEEGSAGTGTGNTG